MFRVLILCVVLASICSCSEQEPNDSKMLEEENQSIINQINKLEKRVADMGQDNLLANNINLFENSPAWDLAQAVEKEDTELIKKLSEANPKLLEYQETTFGQTLLEWAVYTNRYQASKALAEAGANPNIQSNDGSSAFIHAAEKSETSDYVKLLLEHGADVNAVAKPSDGKNQYLKTPLIAAASGRLESAKLLVEKGADIDFYADKMFRNAIYAAYSRDNIEIVKYLIVEKGADFTKPLTITLNGDTLYIANLMRGMAFPLESEEYRLKMEVAEYLKARGMNYWETEIPPHLFNNYSKEYLEKY